MTLQQIQQYYTEIDKLRRMSGSRNENVLRPAFERLLHAYCADKQISLVNEVSLKTPRGNTIRLDGTLKDSLRQDWGYWESKDEQDLLDDEIAKKLAKGYPTSNMLFEDSQTAVLYRDGREMLRVQMLDAPRLHALLQTFVTYEPPHVQSFREAIERFKADLPDLLTTLREQLDHENKADYVAARAAFHTICQEAINPNITLADIREMMIQHILTEDIFATIFEESKFHEDNNIAREIRKVTNTFFTGTTRQNILRKIKPYYQAIKAQASAIADHHEKQRFLKTLYENFYKAYNPKAADTLGIVYTPHEIVHFMLEATDTLLQRHFNRLLADDKVEILDPATGTGTFITQLLEYLPPHRLKEKYPTEIHANEVAILPYYIANLNIEATYAQKMNEYLPFENLCFVDTLDNLDFGVGGHQYGMFDLSDENLKRIKRQNERTISVIIGNPPYNANQQNENDSNKNREYRGVDERIKQTYIKASAAHKTKLYDMYPRFIRWASDRIKENGMVCFITNNSFIKTRTYDGFRKCVQDEFDYAYVIDLGGNIRELSGKDGIYLNEKHTIFGAAAAVGIAITFLVKKQSKSKTPCQIFYIHPCDIRATRDEKIEYLQSHKIGDIPFEHIQPDKKNNWVGLTDNDWETLLPVTLPKLSGKKTSKDVNAIFDLTSHGTISNRDDWVYDFSKQSLREKLKFYINHYNLKRINAVRPLPDNWYNDFDTTIKWTQDIRQYFEKNIELVFSEENITTSLYRPFVKKFYYYSKWLNWSLYQMPSIFVKDNIVITIKTGDRLDFYTLASKYIPNLNLYSLDPAQCLPLYRYDGEGNRRDNITDFALEKFNSHYKASSLIMAEITAEDVFHYVYAVLHDPAYRTKYELNLKRELPRIPFYDDFWQWAGWGQRLMALHVGFETVAAWELEVRSKKLEGDIKAKLKADKERNVIEIDSETTLHGVPAVAWEYKLGNRSALEWVLDRYKEKTPSDPTIAEKFNTYRFADYKADVIALLGRVCTVSVETMGIVGEMGE